MMNPNHPLRCLVGQAKQLRRETVGCRNGYCLRIDRVVAVPQFGVNTAGVVRLSQSNARGSAGDAILHDVNLNR